jgi:hypothetical protein
MRAHPRHVREGAGAHAGLGTGARTRGVTAQPQSRGHSGMPRRCAARGP